ncbi:alpha-E domain-containing protein [Methylophilus aquaticus]|uniref:Alpha-E domain-containing protein n=1 Tax=Methylophilus aquaticus TaxID=1971610 RepID=A0ABT9JNU7_9PROT|nr:alpha-E domain-containing protein [Methylophilus aquaticus]MDP8566266.1 alpha-E domain-containing protein [Methylophilus aquaticus]
MLSRTADNLYWMARYIERAENVARVLDVTYHMSLLPSDSSNEADLWNAVLEIAGIRDIYDRTYKEINATNVILHLVMDSENPSSIYSSLRSARENARAVRVAMTTETWENMNTLWLEFGQYIKQDLTQSGLGEFCEWVKSRSHLFRGVCFGTMLRDDAFSFVRLGTFMERADNTARLLDVKYDFLMSQEEASAGAVDYYEWSAVLRSVSAFQAYQKVYSDAIDPLKVSELLVLRHDMPRSLHACYDEIMPIIEQVAGSRQTEARRLAGELHARLHYGKMLDIFKFGLRDFLDEFITANHTLGKEIQRSFLSATV